MLSRIRSTTTCRLLVGTLAIIGLALPAVADDDRPGTRMPLLPKYQQECAACHLAYPPGMLPAASWQRLMNNLPMHFGTDASLDPASVRELSNWLASNAAPPSGRARRHRKIASRAPNGSSANMTKCRLRHGSWRRSRVLPTAPPVTADPNKEISMNDSSASRAKPAATEQAGSRILVWDLPVRVFHWLLVLSFAGAYLSAESERWRLLHVTLGYTVAGLVCFRILWGLVGTRYARFANFVCGPRAVARYVGAMVRGKPNHATGHNPAGALAILALLALALVVGVSGWATYNEVGGEWLEDVHDAAANLMLGIVVIHVAGVIVASWLHRENLVAAMITGIKRGAPREAISRVWRSVAAVMLAAVLAFWWYQWQAAPAAGTQAGQSNASAKAGHDDGD